MTIKRRGAAKAQGNAFEDIFFRISRLHGVSITRIPDGCRMIGKGKIIPLKSPWDFVLSYKGRSAFVDTKTTEGDSFPHSMITKHQAEELAMHNRASVRAGYVVWLRKVNRVFYMPGVELERRLDVPGSFDHGDESAILLGDIGNFDVRYLFVI